MRTCYTLNSTAKDVAEKYKDLIDQRTYEALMNYQVEITD